MSKWHYSREVFKNYLPVLIITFTVFSIDYLASINTRWQNIREQQLTAFKAGRLAVESDLGHVIADTRILASTFKLIDDLDENSLWQLEGQFLHFSQNKSDYDQLRFLDLSGQEIIRVDREKSTSILTPKTKLQNKANRYYFQQSIALKGREIYLSPIDLNMENGIIELPIKPTFRLAMPVYNSSNEHIGIVIINFLASHLLDNFLVAASALDKQKIFLVNEKGQLLFVKGGKGVYNWTIREVKTFGTLYPQLWAEIQRNLQGQMQIDEGYYTFTSIKPIPFTNTSKLNTSQPHNWILISQLHKSELNTIRFTFLQDRIPIYMGFMLVALFFIAIYTRVHIRHLQIDEQHKQEKRFRQVLEEIKLAAVTIHPNGHLMYYNQHFLDLTGYDSDSLSQKDWFALFIPDDNIATRQQLRQLLQDPTQHLDFECNMIRKDHTVRTFQWTSSFFTDHTDNTNYLTLIGSDITEQKEAEVQLRRLSHVVEQAPVTVMVSNTDGVITYVNPLFTKLTGYQAEEAIGRTPSFLQSGQQMHRSDYDKLWQTISAGDTWHGEFCNRKKDGSLYWEAASISPLKNEHNEIISYIALKKEITEEKRLAEELEKEQEERIKQEQHAAVGRMAYSIAHDLRNPLSSIKMTLQMLPAKLATSSYSDMLELSKISMEQILYMEDILTSLLAYARPDALRRQWVSIEEIIKSVIATEHSTKPQNIQINFQADNNLPAIHVDPTKIRQALQNLIVNAMQAATEETEQQPSVSIHIELIPFESNDKLLISISNNGSQISPEIGKRIYEPFYTTKARGTGLGLSIVQKVILQHYGSIEFTLSDEGLTVCHLFLPIDVKIAAQNGDNEYFS